MENAPRKLVIIGNSAFAEIANEYFTFDSDYDVVGFSVEKDFITTDDFCGLPLVAFEDIEAHFSPRIMYTWLLFTQN